MHVSGGSQAVTAQGLGPCGEGLRGFESHPPHMLSFIMKAGKLKEIKRAGWIRIGIEDAESVACHTFRVALIAMLLGDYMNLNTEKLMKMALLHDLAEVITGDITPHDVEKRDKMKMEEMAMKKLLLDELKNREYYNLWKEFMEGKSREAELLHQIDKFEMILQAYEYSKKYDKKLLEEFFNEKNKIKEKILIELLNTAKSI